MKTRIRKWLALLATIVVAAPVAAGPLDDALRVRQADGIADAGEAAGDDAKGRQAFTPPVGVTVERDLAYGGDPAQRLDVYRPAQAEAAPLILVVHGGAWRFGDKGRAPLTKNKVAHWTRKGCVLVFVNYRLMPMAGPLVQAEDVALAMAYVQREAKRWGADPARIVLMGHSSGAHLVSLLGADGALAARKGAAPWLATVSIDTAAIDIEAIMRRSHYGFYDKAFGSDPNGWQEASPMARLKSRPATPMLMICSSRRSDSCPPARDFAAKANAAGGRVKVLPVDLNHGQVNDQLGVAGAYTDAVDEFLRSVGIP